MEPKYQVDGDIFREITGNWLYAVVKESVIVARMTETDQSGNTIEYFKLNDGRVFTRQMQASHANNPGDEKGFSQIIRLVTQNEP